MICWELCREEMEVSDFLAVGALSGVSSCFSFSGVGTSACGGGPGSGIGWNRNSICRITLGAATQSIHPSSCLQGGHSHMTYTAHFGWKIRKGLLVSAVCGPLKLVLPSTASYLAIRYRAGLKSGPQVARIFQAR